MRLRRLIATLLLTVAPLAAVGQDMASLQADQVAIAGDSLLTATGNVEVRYKGQILRAAGVRYDRTRDHLTIEGPITVTDPAGHVITAARAELSADLSEGLLTSARFVLNRQMQIAARQMFRTQGRYTQLTDTVASSCQVCTIDPVPLWEIRADKVVHDQVARQLWFSGAQLRVAGLPVAYVPQLRMPDPTLNRATGVLAPTFRTTTDLGTGIELPYFIALGPSRDLTVSPFLSTKDGRTLKLRYREAFTSGSIEITAASSRDSILPGQARGYVVAEGDFRLPDGFQLRFSGTVVQDEAYLLDYGISDEDRIESSVEVSRTRRNEYVQGRIVNYRSIRDIGGQLESNATLPTLIGDFTLHRRFSGGPLGGEAGLRVQAHSHYRSSDSEFDSDIDPDDIADGRDVSRLSVRADWRRNWIFGPGLVGSVFGEGTADIYSFRQDAEYAGTVTRLHGAAAAELRWPWTGSTADGAAHVIEPVAQVVVAPSDTSDIPNEDSALVEFDEGNLFSLGRFSGSDGREEGRRMNLGLSWTRFDPAGWSLAMAAGRVYRMADEAQFTAASGLDGINSDWLLSGQVSLPQGLSATGRALLDPDYELTKAELRLDLDMQKYGLSTSYVWLQADTSENRPVDTQELFFDGRYALTPTWTGKLSGRYDLEADRANRAAIGFEFRNECLKVDLSLSRRFTTSTSVKPTTNIGVSVDLLGFGGKATAGPARACRG
ncbi:LPS-assembly protein LptD [Gemmobacter lanyuensis]|uniref:LPS-assembly protein LptD n=1 Tax=Gemmobacter lanyuensis TaxID=1054497 RepID=A0A918ILJ4_9RHOB|nr:LPS assembly protein LptD [Gemmobacter lanyuensis]GGW21972.1 LPS-assembly protein LptD [Gemmobacter lanyuensis]